MFYDILDKKRSAILPLFKIFKNDFYLAGGTGLALQIGHRDSVDFDFFSPDGFSTEKLYGRIKKAFVKHDLLKVQEEKNTLTVLVDGIKISFFGYDYTLVGGLLEEEYFNIASLTDIACMKASAIVSRAANKDYIDLYFILRILPLTDIITALKKKMRDLDANLVLKSLVYFDDIVHEPIAFKHGRNVRFLKVKEFLATEVRKAAFNRAGE